MQKKYFENFDFITEVKNAKSLSFIATSPNTPFSRELFKEFAKILEHHEERFRISLHNSSEDDLHNMVIGMKKGSYVYPHKHAKSESYQILSGNMALLYFDEKGNLLQNIMLNNKKNLIARVDKNCFHAAIALSDVIYHETRIGPFVAEGDSIFAEWFDTDKSEYMKNLLQIIQE